MQRKLVLAAFFALSASALAQATDTKPTLTGHWTAVIDYYGAPANFDLDLTQQGDQLTGKFRNGPLEGATDGASFHFLVKDNEGGTAQVKGTIVNNALQGEVIETDGSTPTKPATYTFTATQRPPRPSAAPQSHDFAPTVFYRQFSPFNKPVLTINPGDTVHTTTVDAGGNDHDSQKRVMGGNPQTGPFFIQSAMPGDILAVHIKRLRLNRDWAMSDDFLVGRATDSDLAVKMKDAGKTILWHLDLANGTASPAKPSEHLAHYTIPLKPMLGCVATATGPAQSPPGTGDSGYYGGNMDFNEITEGNTVYLPVSNPGALLYLGDGHAAQGDGELNGNALETSMDVEFTVDVIPNKHLPSPRVESPTSIIALGYDGSLDSAFREATSNMAQWLTDDYNLTPTEVAQVLGTASQYKVAEVADRNAGVALKVDKALLHPLPRAAK
ncbi:MAG TPA: acetamidase/formamidase family protein [Edaphobacter sp.]